MNGRMEFQEQEQRFSLGFGELRPVPAGLPVPRGGQPGDLLARDAGGERALCWVTPADRAEQDNTRPITAAAVYTEIGNINALLGAI